MVILASIPLRDILVDGIQRARAGEKRQAQRYDSGGEISRGSGPLGDIAGIQQPSSTSFSWDRPKIVTRPDATT
jgi:hypothetical protein